MSKLMMISLLLGACAGGMKRTPTEYRNDTQQLLASRTSDVETCYAKALATDPKAGGLVTVKFTVEKKTGKVAQAAVDQVRTTAPEPVMTCVIAALSGLTLQPPDRNEGRAAFAYELRPAM